MEDGQVQIWEETAGIYTLQKFIDCKNIRSRNLNFYLFFNLQVLLTLGSSYELVENVQDTHWRAPRQRIRKVDLAVPDVEAKVRINSITSYERLTNLVNS